MTGGDGVARDILEKIIRAIGKSDLGQPSTVFTQYCSFPTSQDLVPGNNKSNKTREDANGKFVFTEVPNKLLRQPFASCLEMKSSRFEVYLSCLGD